MKRSVFEIIKSAVKGFLKNPIILIPGLLLLLIIWAGSFLIKYMFLVGLDLFISVPLSIILAGIIISAMFYLGLGGLGMAKEIVDRKKAKWSNIQTYWNKFYGKYIGISIAILLIITGIGIVAALLGWIVTLLTGGVTTVAWIAFSILGLITILVALLFSLSTSLLLIENKTVKKSINRSIKVVKNNYGSLILLLAIFMITSIVLQLIPLGQIGNTIWQGLVGLIIGVVQTISLMMFASERR